MNIYQFVTPSDPITFKAKDDKIAFACTVLLGDGKVGCRNNEGESLPTMLILKPTSDADEIILDFLGMDLSDFLGANKKEIADAYRSFCYGDVDERESFDSALSEITDPQKLKKFLKKHDEDNRSSISSWVTYAWKTADNLTD